MTIAQIPEYQRLHNYLTFKKFKDLIKLSVESIKGMRNIKLSPKLSIDAFAQLATKYGKFEDILGFHLSDTNILGLQHIRANVNSEINRCNSRPILINDVFRVCVNAA